MFFFIYAFLDKVHQKHFKLRANVEILFMVCKKSINV